MWLDSYSSPLVIVKVLFVIQVCKLTPPHILYIVAEPNKFTSDKDTASDTQISDSLTILGYTWLLIKIKIKEDLN